MANFNVDKKLLVECEQGSRRAQYELYRLCYGILLSVCLRYEKNKEDAEFLLNKAFFKILKNLKNYQDKVPFEAWIRRITINTAIDEYRKSKRSKIDYVEEPMPSQPLAGMDFNEAEKKFDADELLEMVKKLPPVSQKVFNLYVIDGYGHKEIGERLEMSEGTSKWHLSSARKKLKAMLTSVMNNVAIL
jgi:RNA polymerase sigma-70 factor (ECF subfamily)